jgi:hypothetical protein
MKKQVIWSQRARVELRAIERVFAMQILTAIDRYMSTGLGDVKKLEPPYTEFRLRAGN